MIASGSVSSEIDVTSNNLVLDPLKELLCLKCVVRVIILAKNADISATSAELETAARERANPDKDFLCDL